MKDAARKTMRVVVQRVDTEGNAEPHAFIIMRPGSRPESIRRRPGESAADFRERANNGKVLSC